MKLLVIVLCLLSERFLVHKLSLYRFHWFSIYYQTILSWLPSKDKTRLFPWCLLSAVVVPVLLIVGFMFHFFSPWLFGAAGLIMNIIIFYFCIGPINPFYPVNMSEADSEVEEVGDYLIQVNNQLFAIMLWYALLGPLSIVLYRLISFCRGQAMTSNVSQSLLAILDWVPARIVALLFLLVGNFQMGWQFFCKHFFTSPQHNEDMLKTCGLKALARNENETKSPTMLQAERLVEHAVIVLLVLLAFYTLASSR